MKDCDRVTNKKKCLSKMQSKRSSGGSNVETVVILYCNWRSHAGQDDIDHRLKTDCFGQQMKKRKRTRFQTFNISVCSVWYGFLSDSCVSSAPPWQDEVLLLIFFNCVNYSSRWGLDVTQTAGWSSDFGLMTRWRSQLTVLTMWGVFQTVTQFSIFIRNEHWCVRFKMCVQVRSCRGTGEGSQAPDLS